MEKMKQKDAEERLKRMDTKQRRGSPTVRFFFTIFFFVKFQFMIEIKISLVFLFYHFELVNPLKFEIPTP